MAAVFRAAVPIMHLAPIGMSLIGLAGLAAGAFMVCVGRTPASDIALLGQHFQTTNVGAILAFSGATSLALTIRSAVRTLRGRQ